MLNLANMIRHSETANIRAEKLYSPLSFYFGVYSVVNYTGNYGFSFVNTWHNVRIIWLKMSRNPLAYKKLVLYNDSQIARPDFLGSQILGPSEISHLFLLFKRSAF